MKMTNKGNRRRGEEDEEKRTRRIYQGRKNHSNYLQNFSEKQESWRNDGMREIGSGKDSGDELEEEASGKRSGGSPIVIRTQSDEALIKVFAGCSVIQLDHFVQMTGNAV